MAQRWGGRMNEEFFEVACLIFLYIFVGLFVSIAVGSVMLLLCSFGVVGYLFGICFLMFLSGVCLFVSRVRVFSFSFKV